MQPEGADRAHLWDMLESARAVRDMIAGLTIEAYSADRRTRRAVEREIEIIGEAARRISDRCRAAHPEIPWRRFIAQRNVLIHEYGEIRDDLVWQTAKVTIPALISQLESLVPLSPPDPEPNESP